MLVGHAGLALMEKPLSNTDDQKREPIPTALTAAHIVYGLHAFAIGLGIVGASTVVGGFVYRWQIRTFWFALMWLLLAMLLIVTLIGAPVGLGLLVILTLWLIYRIARGWLRLLDRQPMYV
jgi:uncharacterized membrane protein